MEKFFTEYFSNSRIYETSYDSCNKVRNEYLTADPLLHIPNWDFVDQGQCEIIVKSYAAIIWGKDNKIYLEDQNEKKAVKEGDIFSLLKKIESLQQENAPPYFGFLSYNLYQRIEDLPAQHKFYDLPEFYVILPADMLIINYGLKKISSFNNKLGFVPETSAVFSAKQENGRYFFAEKKESYLEKIGRIKELIKQGEVYQVNYTQRISAEYCGNSYDFFKKLYAANPAPFSVFAAMPKCSIISSSPERFISVDCGRVKTEPIKGTIKRSANPHQDKQQIKKLLESKKDDAELSMIVDLLRNDISKVCLPGSVQVKEHRRLETFSNVHHLVSTVSGQMQENKDFVDLLEACFPGGSISGCPKIAALKYICELEDHERSFYTGSFFIRMPGKDKFDSNILIRTALHINDHIHFQAGGGIVIDSGPEQEYNECLAKADSFLKVLGN